MSVTPLLRMISPTLELDPPARDLYLYTLGELTAHRDLSFGTSQEQTTPGTTCLTLIISTIRGLYGKTSKREVSAHIEGIAHECALMNSVVPPPSSNSVTTTGPSDYDRVTAEIGRRQEWLLSLSDEQSLVEEALEEAEHALHRETGKRKITPPEDKGALEASIRHLEEIRDQIKTGVRTALTNLRTTGRHEIERLKAYQHALELVQKGIPQGLLEADLPAIPECTYTETVLTGYQAGGDMSLPDSNEGQCHASPRDQMLTEIASRYNLHAVEVFIYSLFELFGEGNQKLKGIGRNPLNRSLNRVIDTALESMHGFSWKGRREMICEPSWSTERAKAEGYLKHCGSMAHITTWVRTNMPLPWKATDIFSEDEIATFLEQMK